ncbi:hypothetical protein BC829DRAFT_64352 [Chytridium lagenaria]|nr:hypothetical protein BC829DRAFT_64352 [Chytridium lagenaria]
MAPAKPHGSKHGARKSSSPVARVGEMPTCPILNLCWANVPTRRSATGCQKSHPSGHRPQSLYGRRCSPPIHPFRLRWTLQNPDRSEMGRTYKSLKSSSTNGKPPSPPSSKSVPNPVSHSLKTWSKRVSTKTLSTAIYSWNSTSQCHRSPLTNRIYRSSPQFNLPSQIPEKNLDVLA